MNRQSNYEKEIERLFQAGTIREGEVYNVLVAHDDWCSIYKNKPCDCDPDIFDCETGEALNRKGVADDGEDHNSR